MISGIVEAPSNVALELNCESVAVIKSVSFI